MMNRNSFLLLSLLTITSFAVHASGGAQPSGASAAAQKSELEQLDHSKLQLSRTGKQNVLSLIIAAAYLYDVVHNPTPQPLPNPCISVGVIQRIIPGPFGVPMFHPQLVGTPRNVYLQNAPTPLNFRAQMHDDHQHFEPTIDPEAEYPVGTLTPRHYRSRPCSGHKHFESTL